MDESLREEWFGDQSVSQEDQRKYGRSPYGIGVRLRVWAAWDAFCWRRGYDPNTAAEAALEEYMATHADPDLDARPVPTYWDRYRADQRAGSLPD